MLKKPKVGFIALCAPVHVEVIDDLGRPFPVVGAAEMACRALEKQGIEVIRYPKKPLVEGKVKGYQVKDFNKEALIDSRKKAEEAFDYFVAEHVDCVVTFFTTWMWVGHYTQTILRARLPIVAWSFPRQEGCQMVGLLGMHGTLDELGLEHEMVYGMHDDPATQDKLMRYIKACAVVNTLKKSKYGRFGGRCMDMIPGLFDNNDWLLKFGVEVEELGQEVLVREGGKFKDKEIKDVYSRIKRLFDKVPPLTDTYMEKNIRFYLAHKKVAEEHGIDFSGIKCVFELSDYYCKPCIAQSLMAEDGYATACCCEDKGALTEYIMRILSDKVQFQGDVEYVDVRTGKIHMVSCGAAAPSLAGNKSKAGIYAGPPIEGEAGGYSVTMESREGDVTLARLSRVKGEYVMVIAAGKLYPCKKSDIEACGFINLPHFNIMLEGNAEIFLQNLRSQYMHFVCDNIKDELITVCRLLGIRPILV
ncbi:MAG: hypothetical protein HY578_00790 [Nitrospinae bacterium]|nr:hypothetical protein [Nitrospinota bacterium]